MKKIVQNKFYRVQLINDIWFEKKGDKQNTSTQGLYIKGFALLLQSVVYPFEFSRISVYGFYSLNLISSGTLP